MAALEQAFQFLQENGQVPSIDDLVHILQLCREQRSLAHARCIHMHICKNGLDAHSSLGNHLVPMFLDSGSLHEAQQSFSRLVSQSPSSFTSLMHGYINHGHCQHAFHLFDKLQEHHVCATDYTFVAILKACSRMRSLERGREVHREIIKEEYEGNSFIGNTLVDMYAHCNSPAEAWDVLDTLESRDVLAWNALISGFIECERCEEALNCFEQMLLQGVVPNAVTFKCSLKACSVLGTIEKGQYFHLTVAGAGFMEDLSICNTLVDMYSNCGVLAKALDVFDTISARDVVSWNALMAGYMEHGLCKEALVCLDQMQEEKLCPNAITYVCSLKACGTLKSIEKGRDIHANIAKKTLEKSLFVGNSLVDFYAQCGLILEAQDVFDSLLARDVMTWTSLIAGYAASKFSGKALNCMKGMQLDGLSPNVVSWTAIILGFAEEGEIEMAFVLYRQMQEQGLLPNSVTFVSILKACGEAAALISGRNFHAQVHHTVCGLQPYESSIAIALVDMYARCGNMRGAQQVFNAIPIKGVIEYNTIIAGYARHGASKIAFNLMEQMRGEEILPDGVSFVSLLCACSHVGLLVEGLKYFEAMSNVHHIAATIKHHSCLVDLLSRTGQLDEALAVLERIPSQSDLVIWSSVLAACRKSGNVNIGRQAFHCAVAIDEKHSTALISMLSIYTGAGMGQVCEMD